MQVIIIEDEVLTAEDLAALLLKMPLNIKVVKLLDSVKAAVAYLQTHPSPDLIFCDIQLGDGHSFEIFKQVHVKAPVIFCTAYNEYALEAFNNNGIGYILKPFTRVSIRDAVDKFILLKNNNTASLQTGDHLQNTLLQNNQSKQTTSILVSWKDRIIPVKINDVAVFGIEHKSTTLVTKSNQHFLINHTLEELEEMCGIAFYRANRQYLINRSAVAEVQHYSSRKLFVKLQVGGDYDITIAKAKVPEFLSWLKS
ncbi:MAG: hypothetical protein RL172_799 [Bacteroidota bacterium]|jgi:two-component system, LytTR family, response regulator LytT